MNSLENATGYIFRDRKLLETALSHTSYIRECSNGEVSNERLEFLGDAFLDAIIGEKLYRMFPDREEGFLTKVRASLVCEKTLAQVARRMNLGEFLKLGYGEDKTGGRNRESILADAVEAVIGAVYMDGGYENAKSAVLRMLSPEIERTEKGQFDISDYKTRLQEILQAEGMNIGEVKYIDAGESGPDHAKVFTVRLEIAGKVEAEEKGKNKKQAQQACARVALMRRSNAV